MRYFIDQRSVKDLTNRSLNSKSNKSRLRDGILPMKRRDREHLNRSLDYDARQAEFINERKRAWNNNESLYPDLSTYYRHSEVQLIDFKNTTIHGHDTELVAIEHLKVSYERNYQQEVVSGIYALAIEKEDLIIHVYRLNCFGSNDVNKSSPTIAAKNK